MSQPSSDDVVRLICLGSSKAPFFLTRADKTNSISIQRYHHACDDSSLLFFFLGINIEKTCEALYIGGREREIIFLRELPHLHHGYRE